MSAKMSPRRGAITQPAATPLETDDQNDISPDWQTGYGAFSVGQDGESIGRVRGYIERQEEHHRGRSFQDEFRLMLTRYGIAFDKKYVRTELRRNGQSIGRLLN